MDPSLASMQNASPIDMLQPEDASNVVARLVSDEAKFMAGVALSFDAGFTIRPREGSTCGPRRRGPADGHVADGHVTDGHVADPLHL